MSKYQMSYTGTRDRMKSRAVYKRRVLTEINLAPSHNFCGDGKGISKRPTPYIATAKKWRNKLSGRGFRPESKATGPSEQIPPRLR